MSEMNKLADACQSYQYGHWEILASVAGNVDAQASVESSLEAAVLSQGAGGAAISPMRVGWRVEALACFAPKRLNELATMWPAPMSLNEMSGGADAFFIQAWRTSLRHLYRLKAITRPHFDCPAFQEESDVVWGKVEAGTIAWRQITEEFAEGFVTDREIRRLANCPLSESVLNDRDIDRCMQIPRIRLQGDVTFRRSPLQILRLLRGRAEILDSPARAKIAELFTRIDLFDPIEQAILIELGMELGLDISEVAATQLRRQILETKDPTSVCLQVFVLMGEHWQTP